MARTRPARPKGQQQGKRPGSAGAARSATGSARTSGGSGTRGAQGRPAATAKAPPAQASRDSAVNGGVAAVKNAGGAAKRTPGDAGGPPRWFQLTTFALSVAGLGVSIYLTITHYSTSVSLACPNTGAINCEKVTTSPESIVFGIPVAVLGLAFFVFMVAVNNPLAWRSPLRVLNLARVLSVIVGIGFVIYLIYVELFKVSAICLWCTSVHVITFALFLLIVFGAAAWGAAASDTPTRAR
jgi:uncharacterized membrane protein